MLCAVQAATPFSSTIAVAQLLATTRVMETNVPGKGLPLAEDGQRDPVGSTPVAVYAEDSIGLEVAENQGRLQHMPRHLPGMLQDGEAAQKPSSCVTGPGSMLAKAERQSPPSSTISGDMMTEEQHVQPARNKQARLSPLKSPFGGNAMDMEGRDAGFKPCMVGPSQEHQLNSHQMSPTLDDEPCASISSDRSRDAPIVLASRSQRAKRSSPLAAHGRKIDQGALPAAAVSSRGPSLGRHRARPPASAFSPTNESGPNEVGTAQDHLADLHRLAIGQGWMPSSPFSPASEDLAGAQALHSDTPSLSSSTGRLGRQTRTISRPLSTAIMGASDEGEVHTSGLSNEQKQESSQSGAGRIGSHSHMPASFALANDSLEQRTAQTTLASSSRASSLSGADCVLGTSRRILPISPFGGEDLKPFKFPSLPEGSQIVSSGPVPNPTLSAREEGSGPSQAPPLSVGGRVLSRGTATLPLSPFGGEDSGPSQAPSLLGTSRVLSRGRRTIPISPFGDDDLGGRPNPNGDLTSAPPQCPVPLLTEAGRVASRRHARLPPSAFGGEKC